MKIRMYRKELSDALTHVSAAIPARPDIAILGAVEIVATGERVTLRGTDWTTTLWASTAAEVSDEGVAYVNGHRLKSLVAAFESPEIDLVLDGGRLSTSSGRSTLQSPTLPAEHFPAAPKLPPAVGSVDAAELRAALAKVRHAVGPRELPGVSGVQITGDGDSLWLEATTRYVIAVVPIPYQGEPFVARLDHGSAASAAKSGDGPLFIHADDSSIGFVAAERTALSRLIAEKGFPELREFAQRASGSAGASFVADRQALDAALARTMLVIDRNASASIEFSNGVARMSVDSENSSLSEEVDVDSAEGALIFINPAFARSVLAVIGEPSVRLTVPASGAAGALRIAGLAGDDESDDIHIIQTMRNPRR